jgi:hypothetical protein
MPIADRPYEHMNITGVKGLIQAEIAPIKALVTVEWRVKYQI